MEVQLLHAKKQELVPAKIEIASQKEMPFKKNGWQFNWKTLYKTEGTEIFKLTTLNTPSVLEGLIMLSLMYGEMLYMDNIEIAPHNIGREGIHAYSAGCLLAYGCKKGFEKGKGPYRGYLTFESKTQLIPLYQQKYGAVLAKGRRMFIPPEAGLLLINKYLENHG